MFFDVKDGKVMKFSGIEERDRNVNTNGWNIKIIGEDSFRGADYVEEIFLHGTIAEIEKNAFRFCTALRRIFLPDTLSRIDVGAFADCPKLDEIIIYSGSLKRGFHLRDFCKNGENFDYEVYKKMLASFGSPPKVKAQSSDETVSAKELLSLRKNMQSMTAKMANLSIELDSYKKTVQLMNDELTSLNSELEAHWKNAKLMADEIKKLSYGLELQKKENEKLNELINEKESQHAEEAHFQAEMEKLSQKIENLRDEAFGRDVEAEMKNKSQLELIKKDIEKFGELFMQRPYRFMTFYELNDEEKQRFLDINSIKKN